MTITIRAMTPADADADAVLRIYQRGLDGGQASFGTTAPTGVVEHSVYVDLAAHGDGVGTALLHALIASTDAAGIWTIQSGVFPENTASLRLHERAGFRALATRERIGRHHGPWRDVILLERRSALIT